MDRMQNTRDKVEGWLKLYQSRIGTLTKLNRVEEPSYSITAWFETPEYLIDICAWDHACCLNIEAFNKSTEKADFYVEGPCASDAELIPRLEGFLHWIESKKP